MRHVPTTIYIDTEFICSQQLRFDTSEFAELKKNFKKGGLRLLVPEVMEREVLRHFDKCATKVADKMKRAYDTYPFSISGINKTEIEEIKEKCYNALIDQWNSFKNHFAVECLPIVGKIEDVVDWYFDVAPPFSEKKQKEFPDAFILSAIDQFHS